MNGWKKSPYHLPERKRQSKGGTGFSMPYKQWCKHAHKNVKMSCSSASSQFYGIRFLRPLLFICARVWVCVSFSLVFLSGKRSGGFWGVDFFFICIYSLVKASAVGLALRSVFAFLCVLVLLILTFLWLFCSDEHFRIHVVSVCVYVCDAGLLCFLVFLFSVVRIQCYVLLYCYLFEIHKFK